MNALTLTQTKLTITSREIADLTGKQHKHVMRDIRTLLDALSISPDLDSCAKSTTYDGKDGRQYEQYELDKDTCLTLLLGYDPAARMKVVKRWQELEAQAQQPVLPDIPQTLPDALRLAADLAEQNIALEHQVAEQAPKVQGFDRIANAEGLLTLRETATTLKIPERKFIQWMQQHDWLYRRPGKGTLLGYSERIKQGFLEHKAITIHNTVTGMDEVRESVKVTPLGLTALAKKVHKETLQ